tara:strand:+ start:4035 stop:4328 length:294 start_codon:yes stop_codon:yes gene_type:complete
MPKLSRKTNLEKYHKNDVRRQRIQATKLIDRLQQNAFGELAEELSPSRLKSIEILLRKTLPDLATVQIVGDENRPLKMEFSWGSYQDPKIIDATPKK